jgi:hypothetical protein
MPSADFCSAIRRPLGRLSRLAGDTKQTSRGRLNRLRCTTAGSTLRIAPIRFPFASARDFPSRLLQTVPRGFSPCASLLLQLHQVVRGTSTPELSEGGRRAQPATRTSDGVPLRGSVPGAVPLIRWRRMVRGCRPGRGSSVRRADSPKTHTRRRYPTPDETLINRRVSAPAHSLCNNQSATHTALSSSCGENSNDRLCYRSGCHKS